MVVENEIVPVRRYGSMIFGWIGTPICSTIVMSLIWAGCDAADWDADCDADGGCGAGGIGEAAWRSCDIPSIVDDTFWSHKLLFTGLKLPIGGVIGDELSAKYWKIEDH